MMFENQYRTHTCAGIDESVIGSEVRVAGWVENIRDHGGVQFLDLRDHYGVVQVVVYDEALLHGVTRECAVTVSGPVVKRSEETYNDKIATGTVEVKAASLTVLCQGGGAAEIPLPRFAQPQGSRQHRAAFAGHFPPAPQDDRAGLP